MTHDGDGWTPGHDGWTPIDNSPVKVNVASLGDYVRLVSKEIEDFNSNLKDGVLPMARVQSTFAGFGEAKLYRGVHANVLAAQNEMLKDVSFSLQAIAQAALGIYYEYLGGDDLGKANVDDVYDVFWPTDGRTLQDEVNAQQAQPGTTEGAFTGSANAAEHRAEVDGTIPPVDGSSYFNTWDQGFTVGEGGHTYQVYDNESNAMAAPEDPLKQK
ncbi:hypothetical protein [Dactylosporangium matsuzakiense]|uniref:Uncharacterized protein n=1 Tax=Dactylosporangium matsuzakiense TaxID=53360 RepID=A0A9W6NMB8_9ACTN|nr:hypothetical protein [Dactylosporangium matsuzakiense]UWZ45967.1 hypothetical protein Dmats_05735 [Dactylosporangium matsuzakiense]GLL02860.1 hypothetical protein GCM10017581_046020 [Dactylosporangium matsuzakiense]